MRRPVAVLALTLALAACADPRATGTPTPTPSPTPGALCDGVTPVPGLQPGPARGRDRAQPSGLRHRARRATRSAVRRRAAGPRSAWSSAACCARRRSSTSPARVVLGRRARPARARLPSRLREQRPLLRLLHRQPAATSVIAEFRAPAIPTRADPASERVLCTSSTQPFANHNGGMLAFGPDGFLYAGIGDGGGAGDPAAATARTSPACSARCCASTSTRRRGAGGAGQPVRAIPTVWAYGLRNPWRFSFDRATGDLYIGDVGQSALRGDRRRAGRGPRRRELRLERRWRAAALLRADRAAATSRGFTLPVLEYRDRGRLLGHRRLRLPRLRAPRPRGVVLLRRLLRRVHPRVPRRRRGRDRAARPDRRRSATVPAARLVRRGRARRDLRGVARRERVPDRPALRLQRRRDRKEPRKPDEPGTHEVLIEAEGLDQPRAPHGRTTRSR